MKNYEQNKAIQLRKEGKSVGFSKWGGIGESNPYLLSGNQS